jgi:hypothetical protein
MPQKTTDLPPRDWPVLGLILCIIYLTLLLPPAVFLGAKPEILGGAIFILTSTLGGIIGVRAARK